MRKIKRIAKKFLWEFDLFSASACFRNKEVSEVKTSNIGLLSFILGIFFTYVFIYSLVDLLQFKKISYSQTTNVVSMLFSQINQASRIQIF